MGLVSVQEDAARASKTSSDMESVVGRIGSTLVASGLAAASLAACTTVFDSGPPDYAIPNAISAPQVAVMFGIDDSWPGGGGVMATTTTETIVFDDDRWAHAELLYSDYPVAELITPPSDVPLQGRSREVPVDGTSDTFTFAERPPAVIDEIIAGCLRLVLSSWDLEPVDDASVAEFVRGVEAQLEEWLSDAPEDPCEGRPSTPPEGRHAPPSGVLPMG